MRIQITPRREGDQDAWRRKRTCGLLPVAVYLLQPFQQRINESGAATERSRIGSLAMIITERNAEFVSPTYKRILAGTNHFCQRLEADAGDRLLQDQRII